MLDLLQQNATLFLTFAGLLGLAVGSFLNVVAHRLPLMMERGWQEECRALLNEGEETLESSEETLTLSHPRSRCPNCGHQITSLENIPVISWLFLRGRCSGCSKPISPRYPLVEIITGLLSLVVAWHFGFSWQAAAGLAFTWALVALSLIDFDVQLLPDTITLPLLWMGLLLSLVPVFAQPEAAIIGAAAGYLSLWTVYQAFKLATGKEGMGFGDFKLLAVFGAWFGWQYLPQILILSSIVGALVGISLIVIRGRDRNIPIPFGPYLAAAGWICLIWGETLNNAYIQWAGLH